VPYVTLSDSGWSWMRVGSEEFKSSLEHPAIPQPLLQLALRDPRPGDAAVSGTRSLLTPSYLDLRRPAFDTMLGATAEQRDDGRPESPRGDWSHSGHAGTLRHLNEPLASANASAESRLAAPREVV
jgi:hypothetical protein